MRQEKIFAVFGLGIYGTEVCKVLADKGCKVIAVDKEQGLINKVKDIVTEAVLLDSTNEEALIQTNLQDVDVAIVAMGNSIDASILTTILLKNLGVPNIIARAVSDLHGQVLKQIGATEVINIEVEEGRRLAKRIVAPDIVDIMAISKDQSIAELRIPEVFVDKTLQEIDLRKKYHVTLVTVKRTDTSIDQAGNPVKDENVFAPNPDEPLRENDMLVLLGSDLDIEKIKEL